MPDLLTLTPAGLYCPPGDFYIDPWRPVQTAVITHAHSDHARWGHHLYVCTPATAEVLRRRLGPVPVAPLPYGEVRLHNGVSVSLHPAGHILGSAQVRVAHGGDVWVVSGDYKTEADATCAPFELVPCRVFITESTFGLPIYRWRPQQQVMAEVNQWWAENQAQQRTSLMYAYALGKAQRVLAGLDAHQGPLAAHGAIFPMLEAYAAAGVQLPAVRRVGELSAAEMAQAVVIAPPSAQTTPWLNRLADASSAFASGWMQLRGTRRRRNLDKGFALSDHVDWPSLMSTIAATGAQQVRVTHGYIDQTVRYLNECGATGHRLEALPLQTQFGGETMEETEDLQKETHDGGPHEPEAVD